MPEAPVNGTKLHYELTGSGDPLVLVHGSWTDATSWAFVAPALAESFQLLIYDRRGHSRSERPDTQGSVDEDGDDLADLIEALDHGPAHVATSSYGGNVALRLATRRPELFRSLYCHEPPLWRLLEGDSESEALVAQSAGSVQGVAGKIASGDHEGAARQFVEEIAFGPGAWEDELPPEGRAVMIHNAPTFLDELKDPEQLRIDPDAARAIEVPVHLTDGSESPPTFGRVLDKLTEAMPHATRETIQGSGHVPHLTMPERYVEAVTAAVARATGGGA